MTNRVGGSDDLILDLAVLGTVVRVVVEGGDHLRDRIAEAWHLCVADTGEMTVPQERTVHVSARGLTADELTRAIMRLTQDVTLAAIRSQAGRYLMLHAGGLCHPGTGAAIVYVAPGGTGKTTLTRTFGPGLGYISDETIAIGPDGTMAPYLKPLSIRQLDHPGVKDEVAPGSLGLRPPHVQPWVAGVIVLQRDPAFADRIEVREVGLLDAIAILSPEISSLASLDRPLRTCADMIEAAGGLRIVRYAEATQLESLVRTVVESVR